MSPSGRRRANNGNSLHLVQLVVHFFAVSKNRTGIIYVGSEEHFGLLEVEVNQKFVLVAGRAGLFR